MEVTGLTGQQAKSSGKNRRLSFKLQPNQFKEAYTGAIGEYFNAISMKCADYSIDFMPADINEGYNEVLLKYLLNTLEITRAMP